jgi:hypothetical protein
MGVLGSWLVIAFVFLALLALAGGISRIVDAVIRVVERVLPDRLVCAICGHDYMMHRRTWTDDQGVRRLDLQGECARCLRLTKAVTVRQWHPKPPAA